MSPGYCRPMTFDELVRSCGARCRPPLTGPQKGSLDLRAMRTPWSHYPGRYSRACINSGWHEDRQTEPKDRDINKTARRDFIQSTYDRLGCVTDGSLPTTTYQDHVEQWKLKRFYTERPYRLPLVQDRTYFSSKLDRETGRPKTGYAAPLPQVPPVPREYMTTHVDHYRPPYPYTRGEPEPETDEYSRVVRHMLSQFTDVDNHRRVGRNHWHDESGLYANAHLRPYSNFYKDRPPPFAPRLV